MSRTCTYLDPHHTERCTECGVTIDLCLCEEVNDMAQERLWSDDGKAIRAIIHELDSAREAFPGNRHMLCALMEEVGELAQAIMQHDRAEGTTTNQVFKEAVQVATMAIRVATEGDQNFAYESWSVIGENKLI